MRIMFAGGQAAAEGRSFVGLFTLALNASFIFPGVFDAEEQFTLFEILYFRVRITRAT